LVPTSSWYAYELFNFEMGEFRQAGDLFHLGSVTEKVLYGQIIEYAPVGFGDLFSLPTILAAALPIDLATLYSTAFHCE
jgi:hypothetical protein